jgi:hypothetical protein
MAVDVRADRVGRIVSAAAPRPPRPRYLPIAKHGLIGDLHRRARRHRRDDRLVLLPPP